MRQAGLESIFAQKGHLGGILSQAPRGAFPDGRARPSAPHSPASQAAPCSGPDPLPPLLSPFCLRRRVKLCLQERFVALLRISLEWLPLSTGGNPASTIENVRSPEVPV